MSRKYGRVALTLVVLALIVAVLSVLKRSGGSRPPDNITAPYPSFDIPIPETPGAGSGDGTITLDGSSTRPRPVEEHYRPAWWIDTPVSENGRITIAMMHDGGNIRAARLDLGEALGAFLRSRGVGVVESVDVQAEHCTLPDGRVRVFAIVSAATERP